MFKHLKVGMIAATLPFAGGCSFLGVGTTEFACPGGATDGVRCMTAREVYMATDKTDSVRAGMKEATANGNQSPAIMAPPPAAGSQALGGVPVPTIDQPMPIRSQASVMRIWMAPWEDEAGDLHADGYLYTEIESRKWNLGGRFKAPQPVFSPLTGSMFQRQD